MSIQIIDKNSSNDDIEDFYVHYIQSYHDLCIFDNQQIIDLEDYLTPNGSLKQFNEDMDILIRELGITIFYTHNDDVITSIAFIEIEPLYKCFVVVKFLCNNQSVRPLINGKTSATYLLDYIFDSFKNKLILIQPANPKLIPYYTKYRKPSFPYTDKYLKETYGHLLFGKITILKEECFEIIFRSISTINQMVNILFFNSIQDLYNNTYNLSSLKEKLITKLDYLVKVTKQINPINYEKFLDRIINDIRFYDIEDLIKTSLDMNKTENINKMNYGGKKKKTNSKKNKNKTKKHKINKIT
jgi:hypothetical protein